MYDEHISHLKETDDRAACRHANFFYYTRTVKGLSYKLHCRKPITGAERIPLETATEEILLDENKMAEGKTHCDIKSVQMSPNHALLAYSVDYTGDEVYELVIINIKTGETLPDSVKKIASSLSWGDDNTLFYLTQDEQLRPYRMWRHVRFFMCCHPQIHSIQHRIPGNSPFVSYFVFSILILLHAEIIDRCIDGCTIV